MMGWGPARSITITLIFPKIVWTCPLNEPARDLTVHTEKLKPLIKGLTSGRMLFSGISKVVLTSVYSAKNF